MAFLKLGPIIKYRREELGFSQVDLADGICSVPTLSRIENCERMPTRNHIEMLMQRLGYSAMSIDYFTDERDFHLHELKIQIRQAYIAGNYPLTREYLERFTSMVSETCPVDQQFLILYDTLLNESQIKNCERIRLFESALLLTCPKFSINYIPRVLSYEEIILLNNIAVCYGNMQDYDHAISLYTNLKDYYARQVISTEEALRTQLMIYYNMSKFLGLNGQYDECIEICDIAIRLARSSGKCSMLDKTLFNRGWALLQRKRAGDIEAAKLSLKQAYCFAEIMEKHENAKIMRDFYEKNFPDVN